MAYIDLAAQSEIYGADIMTNFNKLLSTTGDPLNVKFGTLETTGNVTLGGDVSIPNGFLGFGASTELTISAGVVTATKSSHTIDTEGNAASDDLDTISGGAEGDILHLEANNAARTVVLKDGTGNLRLEGDFSMDNTQDTIMLRLSVGGVWKEVSRSNNGA